MNDNSHTRPLENTLNSFEQVWSSGLNLCECDVALTKDQKIVMAHDETFQRLALCETCDLPNKKVSDLTLSELFSLNLKSGNRPPLLVDCLRSAAAIGSHSKMVIEIKPGNSEIVYPMITLFARHQHLLRHVEVVMSFDLFVIESIHNELELTLSRLDSNNKRQSMSDDRRSIGSSTMKGFHYTSARGSYNARNSGGMDIRKQLLRGTVSYTVEEKPLENDKLPHFVLLTERLSRKDPNTYKVSVKDFSPLYTWLENSNITGVYLEYEEEMLTEWGQQEMLKLAKECVVGVWMDAKLGPDKLSALNRLKNECGVRYVNTDFPSDFFIS